MDGPRPDDPISGPPRTHNADMDDEFANSANIRPIRVMCRVGPAALRLRPPGGTNTYKHEGLQNVFLLEK